EAELVDTCRYYCQMADLIMRNVPVRKFDLNTCTATDLRTIYGISRKTAEKIVDKRPIRSYDELAGLGSFLLDQLKQFTFINRPDRQGAGHHSRHKHSSSIQLV